MPPGRSNWPKGKVERPHVPCPVCGAMIMAKRCRIASHLANRHGELGPRERALIADKAMPPEENGIGDAVAEYDRLVAEGTIVERRPR